MTIHDVQPISDSPERVSHLCAPPTDMQSRTMAPIPATFGVSTTFGMSTSPRACSCVAPSAARPSPLSHRESGSGYEAWYGWCVGPYGRQCRRDIGSTRTRLRTRSVCTAPIPSRTRCCESTHPPGRAFKLFPPRSAAGWVDARQKGATWVGRFARGGVQGETRPHTH